MIIRDADNEAGCPSAGVNCVEVSFLVLAGAVVVVYSEAIEYGGFFIAFVGIHYLYSKFTQSCGILFLTISFMFSHISLSPILPLSFSNLYFVFSFFIPGKYLFNIY